jgi:hypothetical protein
MQKIVCILLLTVPVLTWGVKSATPENPPVSIVADIKKSATPYLIGLTPGEALKSPGEIIEEIKAFKKSIEQKQENDSCYPVNNPADYAKDMDTAQVLIYNVLLARMMCETYLSENDLGKYRLAQFIHEHQAWSRDPMRHVQFKKSHPESQNGDYSTYLDQEKEKIIDDCKHCERYKRILMYYFENLGSLIMYRKPRIEEYMQIREMY